MSKKESGIQRQCEHELCQKSCNQVIPSYDNVNNAIDWQSFCQCTFVDAFTYALLSIS